MSLPHHFSVSRRSRRQTLPLEEFESPPQVTHLRLKLRFAANARRAYDNRPLGTELEQLRARLLRMILENETARRGRRVPR